MPVNHYPLLNIRPSKNRSDVYLFALTLKENFGMAVLRRIVFLIDIAT